jgi:phage antirepressor YoqD-like protein
MENNIVKICDYEGCRVTFRNENGDVYINATEMAKPFGKRPNDYLNLLSTKELIKELSVTILNGNGDNQLIITETGGKNKGGTWFSEELSLDFAQWLNIKFKVWCNGRIKELLKHGATAVNPDDLLNPDFIINLATQLKIERAEKDRLLAQNELQQNVIQLQVPKVEYHDNVLQATNGIATTVIAKELGMTAKKLNKILCNHKIIYRVGKTWVLHHKFQNFGYAVTKTHQYFDKDGLIKTSIQLYWTELGRKHIHEFIKKLKEIELQNQELKITI